MWIYECTNAWLSICPSRNSWYVQIRSFSNRSAWYWLGRAGNKDKYFAGFVTQRGRHEWQSLSAPVASHTNTKWKPAEHRRRDDENITSNLDAGVLVGALKLDGKYLFHFLVTRLKMLQEPVEFVKWMRVRLISLLVQFSEA